MFKDVKDISGEDLDAFGHLQFQRIGYTGDGNNYPIFTGYIGSEKGVWIGVPVDDYLTIIEHLNTIDGQLTKLERGRMSVDEILNSATPRPLNKVRAESQEEYMNRLSGLSMDSQCCENKVAFVGEDNPLIKILADAKYQWTLAACASS